MSVLRSAVSVGTQVPASSATSPEPPAPDGAQAVPASPHWPVLGRGGVGRQRIGVGQLPREPFAALFTTPARSTSSGLYDTWAEMSSMPLSGIWSRSPRLAFRKPARGDPRSLMGSTAGCVGASASTRVPTCGRSLGPVRTAGRRWPCASVPGGAGRTSLALGDQLGAARLVTYR
jgi:hypothetical protein